MICKAKKKKNFMKHIWEYQIKEKNQCIDGNELILNNAFANENFFLKYNFFVNAIHIRLKINCIFTKAETWDNLKRVQKQNINFTMMQINIKKKTSRIELLLMKRNNIQNRVERNKNYIAHFCSRETFCCF